MSTNDAVFLLANGAAGADRIDAHGPAYDAFCAALTELCVDLARQIAADGEGATKRLEVRVNEAPDAVIAVWGLAYKENTASVKNSPSLATISAYASREGTICSV